LKGADPEEGWTRRIKPRVTLVAVAGNPLSRWAVDQPSALVAGNEQQPARFIEAHLDQAANRDDSYLPPFRSHAHTMSRSDWTYALAALGERLCAHKEVAVMGQVQGCYDRRTGSSDEGEGPGVSLDVNAYSVYRPVCRDQYSVLFDIAEGLSEPAGTDVRGDV
jgi:hypothetical protein